jgi:hypothetical protein
VGQSAEQLMLAWLMFLFLGFCFIYLLYVVSRLTLEGLAGFLGDLLRIRKDKKAAEPARAQARQRPCDHVE